MKDLKPGQKHPTPTPGSGDRVFYETLLRQRPDSFMAQEWCVNYGILPEEEAVKMYKVICKKKGIKTDISSKRPKSKIKKKKAIIQEDNYEPDIQVSGGDTIGATLI